MRMDELEDVVPSARQLYKKCREIGPILAPHLSALDIAQRILRAIHNTQWSRDNSDDDSDEDDEIDPSFIQAINYNLRKVLQEIRQGGKGYDIFVEFVIEVSNLAFELRSVKESDLHIIAKQYSVNEKIIAEDHRQPNSKKTVDSGDEINDGEKNATTKLANDDMPADDDGTRLNENGPKIDETPHSALRYNFDALACFHLRSRVFDLSQPTFTKLWKYLQAAGWTFVGGVYHIPKKRQQRQWDDDVDTLPQIVFFPRNEEENSRKTSGDSSYDEEGPETFRNGNEVIDYLDQYCLPYARETPAEIEAHEMKLASKTKAYERRCKRLRRELLTIVFAERNRNKAKPTGNEEESKVNLSKYGHNHRKCDVCFEGAHELYHRVACRRCGLVVHTHCYGLVDHGKNAKSSNAQNEVDAKGFFTCDVCDVCPDARMKKDWCHVKNSDYRYHTFPNAVCKICNWNSIAGGMKVFKEVNDGRSRRSTDEIWAHLFCLNTIPRQPKTNVLKLDYDDVKKSTSEALAAASARIERVEVRYILSNICIRFHSYHITSFCVVIFQIENRASVCCALCCKKGDVLKCDGKCEKFFHRVCIQIDRINDDSIDAKTHVCRDCGVAKNSKRNVTDGTTEEINQYLGRKTKRKTQTVDVNNMTVPTAKQCAADAEELRMAAVNIEYDKISMQCQNEFHEWSVALATSESVLLYGLGSKRKTLTSFGKYLSREGDVVRLDGYNPGVNLSQFFNLLRLSFGGSNLGDGTFESSSAKKQSTLLGNLFAVERSLPLFILINNIDGLGLQSHLAQEALANLKTCSKRSNGSFMIRIVATIDNVNSALTLWSPLVEHDFNWVSPPHERSHFSFNS